MSKPPKKVKAKMDADITRLANLMRDLRGQKVQDMQPKQIAELLAAVLVLMGKAAPDGSIK